MKVKCNFCSKTASGTIDSLIDQGWQRAIIYKPIRKTITCCPEHFEEGKIEIMKTLARGKP
jgi:hypothetical protein